MSDMLTADGQPLPESHYSKSHTYGFYKSSEGRRVDISVQEIRHRGLVVLTVLEETEGWE